MTIWQLLLPTLAVACALLAMLDRLSVDLPGPLAKVAGVAGYLAAGLAGLVVALWSRGDGGRGLGYEDTAPQDSDLPERPPVDEVEGSDEVSQKVDEAADAVEGDWLADDVADEVSEGAGELNELLESKK